MPRNLSEERRELDGLVGSGGVAEVAGTAAFPSAWLVGSRGVQLGLQGKDETLEV